VGLGSVRFCRASIPRGAGGLTEVGEILLVPFAVYAGGGCSGEGVASVVDKVSTTRCRWIPFPLLHPIPIVVKILAIGKRGNDVHNREVPLLIDPFSADGFGAALSNPYSRKMLIHFSEIPCYLFSSQICFLGSLGNEANRACAGRGDLSRAWYMWRGSQFLDTKRRRLSLCSGNPRGNVAKTKGGKANDAKAAHKASGVAARDKGAFEDTAFGRRRVTRMRKWLGVLTGAAGKMMSLLHRSRRSRGNR